MATNKRTTFVEVMLNLYGRGNIWTSCLINFNIWWLYERIVTQDTRLLNTGGSGKYCLLVESDSDAFCIQYAFWIYTVSAEKQNANWLYHLSFVEQSCSAMVTIIFQVVNEAVFVFFKSPKDTASSTPQ